MNAAAQPTTDIRTQKKAKRATATVAAPVARAKKGAAGAPQKSSGGKPVAAPRGRAATAPETKKRGRSAEAAEPRKGTVGRPPSKSAPLAGKRAQADDKVRGGKPLGRPQSKKIAQPAMPIDTASPVNPADIYVDANNNKMIVPTGTDISDPKQYDRVDTLIRQVSGNPEFTNKHYRGLLGGIERLLQENETWTRRLMQQRGPGYQRIVHQQRVSRKLLHLMAQVSNRPLHKRRPVERRPKGFKLKLKISDRFVTFAQKHVKVNWNVGEYHSRSNCSTIVHAYIRAKKLNRGIEINIDNVLRDLLGQDLPSNGQVAFTSLQKALNRHCGTDLTLLDDKGGIVRSEKTSCINPPPQGEVDELVTLLPEFQKPQKGSVGYQKKALVSDAFVKAMQCIPGANINVGEHHSRHVCYDLLRAYVRYFNLNVEKTGILPDSNLRVLYNMAITQSEDGAGNEADELNDPTKRWPPAALRRIVFRHVGTSLPFKTSCTSPPPQLEDDTTVVQTAEHPKEQEHADEEPLEAFEDEEPESEAVPAE